jgi:hypothetical protein
LARGVRAQDEARAIGGGRAEGGVGEEVAGAGVPERYGGGQCAASPQLSEKNLSASSSRASTARQVPVRGAGGEERRLEPVHDVENLEQHGGGPAARTGSSAASDMPPPGRGPIRDGTAICFSGDVATLGSFVHIEKELRGKKHIQYIICILYHLAKSKAQYI